VTDRPDLDERFQELVQRVAERSTAPEPAAIRRRARRRRAGQGAGALLLVAALITAGLAVDRRLGAAPTPAGPAVPSTTAPPTTLLPGPRPVPGADFAGGGRVIAAGTSPKGMRWRLRARLQPGRGLCVSFQVAAPGTPVDQGASEESCGGRQKDVTGVSSGELGGPGNLPAVPEVAVHGMVPGRTAQIRLTLKRRPRDHRSPVAGTVAVRPVHAPGFQVGFFVAFIPVDTWPAGFTLYDAEGRRICSQLGDDFKTPYLPGAMRCT
jgi:hypothetical protein